MRTGVRRSISLLLLGAFACGDDASTRPDAGPRVYDAGPACLDVEAGAVPVSNNSAIVTGAAIGTGEFTVEELRKPIAVELTAPAALEVGPAWAMRNDASRQTVGLAIEVSNPTGELYCQITTEHYRWLDERDETIPAREQIWLIGSIGLDDPLDAMTCLAPGETGYFLDVNLDEVYDQLRAVELEITYTGGGDGLPELAVAPTAYVSGENTRLRFELENTGTDPVQFDTEAAATYGEAVLLDAEGAPLDFMVIVGELEPADGVLQPGATGSIDTSSFYGGCATSLRPFFLFRPAT